MTTNCYNRTVDLPIPGDVKGFLAAFSSLFGTVIFAVLVHNAQALNICYWTTRMTGLPEPDCRAVCIEVGIQNSALCLVLTFFGRLGYLISRLSPPLNEHLMTR